MVTSYSKKWVMGALAYAMTFSLGTSIATAARGVPLQEAAARSIRGEDVVGVQVGAAGFDLKPIGVDGQRKRNVVRSKTCWTAIGSFRHRIVGKDDVVYYRIVVEKGKPPLGEITGIKFRGAKDNWFVKTAGHVTGIDIAGGVEDFQRRRIGSWVASAQMIVDEMAKQWTEMLEAE